MKNLSLENIKKSAIINKNGISYADFRKNIKPRYLIVWIHIAFAWLILAGIMSTSAYLQQDMPGLAWIHIPVLAVLTGYFIAFLQLFIHEAAHYNIAPNRKYNDGLANIFIGLMVGMDIKFYRVIHFEHHKYLGTVHDTEKTYFHPLNWNFIIEGLTGIQAVKVLKNRKNKVAKKDASKIKSKNFTMLLMGLTFNTTLVLSLFYFGYWQTALVWIMGIGLFFPFFGAIRQLLEHRSNHASSAINYNEVDHGVINRLFGTDLLSATFGGAGFNRHLLHHWDPHISYTRLKEVEDFLYTTPYAPVVKRRKTSYLKTFLSLFNK